MPIETSDITVDLPTTITSQDHKTPPNRKLLVKLLRQDSLPPIRATNGSVGHDAFSCESVTIPPKEQCVVGTGMSIALPIGTYGRIAPRSGLTVK